MRHRDFFGTVLVMDIDFNARTTADVAREIRVVIAVRNVQAVEFMAAMNPGDRIFEVMLHNAKADLDAIFD